MNKKFPKLPSSYGYNFIKNMLICSMTLSFLLLVSSCTKAPANVPIASVNGLAFDTFIEITVYDNTTNPDITDTEIRASLTEALNLCQKYDALFSKTTPDSDIYRINHAKGIPQNVSEETILLIKEALCYSELTDGKIDITVSKVKNLWDFSTQDENAPSNCIPDKNQILSALSHVNYRTILLDEKNNTVSLSDPDAELDLGFIAKGYIADKLKEYLIDQGIEHAIINLGGNVMTIGSKPDHTPFMIGIEKPFDSADFIETVSVQDKAVATSGVYQRYFKSDGTLYHHILDPDTGYPVNTDLLSATVISDSSMKADAMSTVCILLGSEEASALMESDHTISAIFVTDDYHVIKINCD